MKFVVTDYIEENPDRAAAPCRKAGIEFAAPDAFIALHGLPAFHA